MNEQHKALAFQLGLEEWKSFTDAVDAFLASLGSVAKDVSHVFWVDDEWKTIEKPSEFVEAVIEVIKRQGWWRSGYGNAHTGQVCVLGAMNLVATGIVDSLCTSHPLWHAVRERTEAAVGAVV